MNTTFPGFFFLLLLAAFRFSSLAFGASDLQDDEEHSHFGGFQLIDTILVCRIAVEALKAIAKTIGKDWDSSIDRCTTGQQNWSSCYDEHINGAVVLCDCTYANGTVCHVTHLCLKRENLSGKLPPELVRLRYLQDIDLYFNYLTGTIPKEWGSMNLVNISVGGNRLTGSIPAEIGNISTLQTLEVGFNQLSGNLPPELGKLTQLQRLQISSNNFSGELPATLANLKSLQDFRLGDNQFSGKIPDFIQSWTRLHRLIIQGSGLSGPIPSGISLLGNLTDLRISDLNGMQNSPFPQLSNMKMEVLVLRSCNINGTLPPYLGAMTNLTTLDLSFNKLTGQIPPAYRSLTNVTNIYLTGNFLTGLVPAWTKKAGNIDLSYNYLNIGSRACQDGKVNLFASSLRHNNSGKISCLRNCGCSKTLHSLHINCGGQVVTINKTTYDSDINEAGPTMFYKSEHGNWAFSSTGNYMDNRSDNANYYTISNGSKLSMTNVELYMNARVSPISLTYFGFCLENGNYTINLHFAEIMFTDDQTYNNLGRRVFNIYIQGNLVQKDFNIAEEAGGNYKAIIKYFSAIVTDNTLEIRFYWAGKGTTAIPFKSVNGPLISAISVEHDSNIK